MGPNTFFFGNVGPTCAKTLREKKLLHLKIRKKTTYGSTNAPSFGESRINNCKKDCHQNNSTHHRHHDRNNCRGFYPDSSLSFVVVAFAGAGAGAGAGASAL
jgi:hypothetical protein